MRDNKGDQFDQVASHSANKEVKGRPTRPEILDWWETRFEISRSGFGSYSFWEKGKGKIWAFHSEIPSPQPVEALGLPVLRTRQEHWKPTTNAVQRFGHMATKNVLSLSDVKAKRFIQGETQTIDWEGEWGYLIITHSLADVDEPLGVGLYLYGELRSQIPKNRQRTF
ncbi:MAG: hypothetical protein ABEI06_04935 [Halobacteriaceae archaeon]